MNGYFSSQGLRIAFHDIRPADGWSRTVVLVHGFATNAEENWRRLGWYGALERKRWRVAALDLRGHGNSDKPREPSAYRRRDMAGDVVALMDHLDIPLADLMGYSLGAHLALGVALEHPERIDHLVLGGVGGRMLDAATLASPGTMTLPEAMRTSDPEAISDSLLKGFRLFADQQGEDRLALAACAEGLGSALSREALRSLRPPTLVAAGSLDAIAGDPAVLAQAIPGAKSATLPACDHFTAIPHALFKAAVIDFLEDWEDEDAF